MKHLIIVIILLTSLLSKAQDEGQIVVYSDSIVRIVETYDQSQGYAWNINYSITKDDDIVYDHYTRREYINTIEDLIEWTFTDIESKRIPSDSGVIRIVRLSLLMNNEYKKLERHE